MLEMEASLIPSLVEVCILSVSEKGKPSAGVGEKEVNSDIPSPLLNKKKEKKLQYIF